MSGQTGIIMSTVMPLRDWHPQGRGRYLLGGISVNDSTRPHCRFPRTLNLPPITPERIAYFWSCVDKQGPNECWPWTKRTNRNGYGQFSLNQRTESSHRIAFLLSGGVFTEDKPYGLHSCNNPRCCNPNHIRAGSNEDNVADKVAFGRQARGEWFSDIRRRTACRGESHYTFLRPGCREHGEDKPNAKLTDQLVKTIRDEYASGGWSYKRLAQRYGVSQTLVALVVRREVWRHVE